MSYYFAIVGTRDNPIFELEFGTSKGGGDGVARFRDDARHLNQFIVHAALDMVEELQWSNRELFLKRIDSHHNSHVHCFLTGGNVKFMLLMTAADATAAAAPSTSAAHPTSPPSRPATAARPGTSLASNPSSTQTEDAVRQFMMEVYEYWIKCLLNPFYDVNSSVTSPVFRGRVGNAARKYL